MVFNITKGAGYIFSDVRSAFNDLLLLLSVRSDLLIFLRSKNESETGTNETAENV